MTRILRSAGLALVIALGSLVGSALTTTPGSATPAQSAGGTALPPGWELCILQRVGAPATQADVADLDAWQAAEGGSTNNTAAYNPFNSGRTTDATGATIPGVVSTSGFPAFATWPEGCEATVTTLLQPNMWSITAALARRRCLSTGCVPRRRRPERLVRPLGRRGPVLRQQHPRCRRQPAGPLDQLVGAQRLRQGHVGPARLRTGRDGGDGGPGHADGAGAGPRGGADANRDGTGRIRCRVAAHSGALRSMST